jgi:hypothetical protein
VGAATLHVDANDPTAFASIQEAIIMSKNSDTVIVHPGVYRETIDFIAKWITVRSTDPNDPDIVARTIIDGSGKTVVAFQSGEKEHAILSGFTIRNGSAGIFCAHNYSQPQIRRCVIISNASYGIQGGASTIVGCTIVQNGSHGIYANGGEVRDCAIVNNGGTGVYMSPYTTATYASMVNCLVSGNNGDGVSCAIAGIVNCVIVGNKGWGARATSGTTMANCTIVRNRDLGVWGAAVSNSIIAYNLGYGLSWMDGDMMRYNCVYGNASGDYKDHNPPKLDMQAEPLFADIGYWDMAGTWHIGDYHLMSTVGRWAPAAQAWVKDPIDSPCLDRGDPNTPVGDEPYPNGGRINLGAYGGTPEASKSEPREPAPMCMKYPEMDFNKDCKVDLADFTAFMEHWLECNLDDQGACWPNGVPATPVVPNTQP